MVHSSIAGQHAGTAARKGILLYLTGMVIFAGQDAVAKFLITDYAVSQLIMIRYWAFAAVALVFVSGTVGLRQALHSQRPKLQIVRSLLVALETGVFIFGLRYLGLAEAHALFALSPLMATALAWLFLHEPLGWRRITALAVGFFGAMLIIKPGLGAFNATGLIPLTAALMFACYNIITRYTAQVDSYQTTLLYMAVIGAVVSTPIGIASWRTPDLLAGILFGCITVSSIAAHSMLMKALQLAQASVLQPFNYFLLLAATVIGFLAFGERPDVLAITGAVLIVAGGLFTLLRERSLANRNAR